MNSYGLPLDRSTREFMEPRFGFDFGKVRIHTDERASRSAGSINALAYTMGNDIVFNEGMYTPYTTDGKKLLAHELSHVIQQDRSGVYGLNRTPYREPTITSFVPKSIQRKDDDDADIKPPGNEYEFKLDKKVGERTAYSLRFIISKAVTNPLVVKGDIGNEGTTEGQIKAQLGATKLSRTKEAGKKVADSMALALAKVDLTAAEIIPGITLKADFKALEAKVENGDIDVNVFKIGVALEGQLTKLIGATPLGKEIMSTKIGELILEGFSIKIQGRFEVNIDPYDAVRLARMAKLNKEIADNTAEAVKAKRKLDALERENRKIHSHLKKRGGKLSKAARKRLKARLDRNAKKMGLLKNSIKKSKMAVQGMQKTYRTAAKGLKSKAGRLVGAAVKKIGGRLLLKLVPGVNIVMTAIDIVEIASGIYKLVTGKAELGFTVT